MAAAVLVLAHVTPAAAQDTIPPDEPGPPYPALAPAEAQAVRAAAQAYISAAGSREGTAAARLVSRGTRDYYARMAQLAVSAPETQVRAAPLMERMMILMYRHRVPAADLRALAGDAAFAYTIDEGWVAQDAEAGGVLAEAEVYGEGDQAVIWMGGDGVYFRREDGGWRWDMTPTLLAASTTMAPPPDSGMTEDEFVMFVLKYSNGRDPSPDIWQPLP
ncbi:MAG TPA: hypothetical protein VFT45_17310 [Longimicrobium sp.]|nr:hypothetical protein [Longimicrobium sp.]